MSTPWRFLISRSASWISVSVVSPRKSILRSGSFSSPLMSNCVTISSRLVLYSGTSSFSGCGEITTPAACTEQLRARPSRRSATFNTSSIARIFPGRFVEARLLLNGVFERDVQDVGHHLGEPLHVREGHFQHAAHVLDGGARAQRIERDDLRHLLAAVFLGDVLDHLAAPVHAEIHVDIGHADALGIQEALEQQPVLQRVDIGDRHRVAHQAAGRRSAARTHRNVRAPWRSG